MIIAIKDRGKSVVLVDYYKDQFMAVTFTHNFRCAKCSGSNEKTFSLGLLYRKKQPYSDQTKGSNLMQIQLFFGEDHITPLCSCC